MAKCKFFYPIKDGESALYIDQIVNFEGLMLEEITIQDKSSVEQMNLIQQLDESIIKIVMEIQSLPDEDKSYILYTLDELLQNVRTKMAFAK